MTERKIIEVDQMTSLFKSYRLEKGITLEKISELSGIPIEKVGYFEENPTKLSSSELRKILHVLDLNEIEFYYGNLVEVKIPEIKNNDDFYNSGWVDDARGRYEKTIILGCLELKFRVYSNHNVATISKPWRTDYWLMFVESDSSIDKLIYSVTENNPAGSNGVSILEMADQIILNTLKQLCEKLENK